MSSLCRYSYLSGACANQHVDSLECIGSDKCEFSGMNILVLKRQGKPRADDCGHEEWLGLYCEKYKRFFCPGREHCVTPESYEKHLVIHRERALRMRQDE